MVVLSEWTITKALDSRTLDLLDELWKLEKFNVTKNLITDVV